MVCASQFFGRSHDGCDVNVRHRGGGLTADVAMTGFCELLGVALSSEVTVETDADAKHQTGFYSRTTSWDVGASQASVTAARVVVAASAKRSPVDCQVRRSRTTAGSFSASLARRPKLPIRSAGRLTQQDLEASPAPRAQERFAQAILGART